VTLYDVLELARHLRFNILLQPTQDEWPNDPMQATNHVVVLARIPFNDIVHWVRKPKRKLLSGAKHVWHEKMQQRPELHQIVLQRRPFTNACEMRNGIIDIATAE
jgi:hypothetical protein